ncbi:MAG: zf-HC2 domain-containing protein [Lachnospiraceae bacterium]|nr:zf-HC2 domain-containing protein [Lachnospiraceae bacterium]
MNKITCELCKDLMPLVKDGIASADSCLAVKEHLKECEECKKIYENEVAEPSELNMNLELEIGKLKRKLQIFSVVLMMFGVFFGLSLTASQEMFYNSLIMPVIGALGYVIFRWKAIYQIPLLLLVMQSLINFLGLARGMEYMPFVAILMWVGIYTIFVELGVLVAGLLHFAFRKER